MAVSYGVTFPVLVLLLSIAFTGYLEVNAHLELYWVEVQSVIVMTLSMSCMFEYVSVFRNGVPRCRWAFSGYQGCPVASPPGQRCECLWFHSVCSSPCLWPSSTLWVALLLHSCSVTFIWGGSFSTCSLVSQFFIPGNNCTAITNRTELEGLKLYTVPVRTPKECLIHPKCNHLI